MKESKSGGLMAYFKGSVEELRKVSWPTKNHAVKMTIIVLVLCLVVVLGLTGVDYLFSTFFSLIK